MNIHQNHISLLKQYPAISQTPDFLESLNKFRNENPELGKLIQDLLSVGDASVSAGRGVGELYSISNDLFKIFQDIQKESGYLEQRYNRLNRVFGVSSITAGKFGEKIDKLGKDLKIGGGFALEYATQLSKIAPNALAAFKAGNKFTEGLFKTQDALIANLGLTEDQAVAFQRFAATRADTTDEFLNQTLAIAQAIEESTDIEGAFRDITLEISSLLTSTRQQFGRIPGSLEVSVLKAKQLGTSFEAISKTGRQLLNVEETINAELEYQLLSGQRLVKNGKSLTAEFQKAFLSGDAERMAQAQYDIVDSQRDVIKTNVLAREQLAKFMGISSDELLNQAEQLDTIDKLSASGIDIDLSSADVDQQIADAIAKAQSDDQKKILEEFKTQRQGVQSTEDFLKQLVDLSTTTGLLTNIKNLNMGGAGDLIEQQQKAMIGEFGPGGTLSSAIESTFGNMPGLLTKLEGAFLNISDLSNETFQFGENLLKALPLVNSIIPLLDVLGAAIPVFDVENDLGGKLAKMVKGILPQPGGVGTYDRAAEAQGITISANTLEVGEIQTRATGGPIAAGVPYLVGERGAELIIPSQNGVVIPNDQVASSNNAGSSINVDIDYDRLASAMANVNLVVESSPEGINIS